MKGKEGKKQPDGDLYSVTHGPNEKKWITKTRRMRVTNRTKFKHGAETWISREPPNFKKRTRERINGALLRLVQVVKKV